MGEESGVPATEAIKNNEADRRPDNCDDRECGIGHGMMRQEIAPVAAASMLRTMPGPLSALFLGGFSKNGLFE